MFSEHAILGSVLRDKIAIRVEDVVDPSTFVYMSEGWAYPNGWGWKTLDPKL